MNEFLSILYFKGLNIGTSSHPRKLDTLNHLNWLYMICYKSSSGNLLQPHKSFLLHFMQIAVHAMLYNVMYQKSICLPHRRYETAYCTEYLQHPTIVNEHWHNGNFFKDLLTTYMRIFPVYPKQ